MNAILPPSINLRFQHLSFVSLQRLRLKPSVVLPVVALAIFLLGGWATPFLCAQQSVPRSPAGLTHTAGDSGQNETPGYDTLVVCAPQLKPALKRWVQYRAAQGRRILTLDTERFALDNRVLIHRTLGRYPGIDHIVLVGDAGDWRLPLSQLLPTDHVLAKVNVNFGSEFDIATDNTYSDPSGDGIPEVAIGRIVATNAQELNQYIDRVISYEGGGDADSNQLHERASWKDLSWKRRINLVAGIGGFGGITDSLIENTTRKIITDKIPGSYKTTMTHGNWKSPYCPDPRRFSEVAAERFNEGCMFWVYLGHGDRQRVDALRVPKQRFEIMDRRSAATLHCRNGSPIAIFLACYAGAIDSSQDSLAEQMMKQPTGPIATIAGSRVTMPYAMSLMAMEMSEEYFHGECQTVGQLLRLAKRRMADEQARAVPSATEDPYRQMIQSLGKTLSPLPKMLGEEKIEHCHLINLLGDPLLQLQRPAELSIEAPQIRAIGQDARRTVSVFGDVPFAGELSVELVYRRDRFRVRPQRRRKFDPDVAALANYQHQYEQAHDLVCSAVQNTVPKGRFEIDLELPDSVRGDCRIRALLTENPKSGGQGRRYALGAAEIDVPRRIATAAKSSAKKKPQQY